MHRVFLILYAKTIRSITHTFGFFITGLVAGILSYFIVVLSIGDYMGILFLNGFVFSCITALYFIITKHVTSLNSLSSYIFVLQIGYIIAVIGYMFMSEFPLTHFSASVIYSFIYTFIFIYAFHWFIYQLTTPQILALLFAGSILGLSGYILPGISSLQTGIELRDNYIDHATLFLFWGAGMGLALGIVSTHEKHWKR